MGMLPPSFPHSLLDLCPLPLEMSLFPKPKVGLLISLDKERRNNLCLLVQSVFTYTRTHALTHKHICSRTCMPLCLCTHVLTDHICSWANTCAQHTQELTHTHTHAHTSIHTCTLNAQAHTCIHMHAHACSHTRVCLGTCVFAHVHARPHTMFTHTYWLMSTFTHIYMLMHTSVLTPIHIHVHTCTSI